MYHLSNIFDADGWAGETLQHNVSADIIGAVGSSRICSRNSIGGRSSRAFYSWRNGARAHRGTTARTPHTFMVYVCAGAHRTCGACVVDRRSDGAATHRANAVRTRTGRSASASDGYGALACHTANASVCRPVISRCAHPLASACGATVIERSAHSTIHCAPARR